MTVVYLDPDHLGDPLFIPGLARDLTARTSGLVLVHGSGERGERALESLGLFPKAADGVWRVDDDRQRGAVERATRELNREVVHEFNEQGVVAVGAMAGDRGLVRVEEGQAVVGKARWVADLVRQGVTVLVGTLVDGAEVDAAAVAGRLAAALDGRAVALSRRSVEADVTAGRARGPGLRPGGRPAAGRKRGAGPPRPPRSAEVRYRRNALSSIGFAPLTLRRIPRNEPKSKGGGCGNPPVRLS